MQFKRLACLVVTSAVLGCGGGGYDGGTNPPPPPPPTQTLGSISTSTTALNLSAGNSQTITVTALDTQGAPITSFPAPTFTSTAANIAEVDGSGSVLAIRAGASTVNVSVTMGSVTRTATVAVTVTGTLPSQASVSTQSGDVFTPNKVIVGIGGQVTWTFGITAHNVTFSTAGSPANINSTSSTSDSRTFSQAGNFSYNCTIHAGMNGQVLVR